VHDTKLKVFSMCDAGVGNDLCETRPSGGRDG
jgi:hypothetical protein